jgi:hypothetical protein
MSDTPYFNPADWEANSRCPGKPALEEFEPALHRDVDEADKRHAAACLLAGIKPQNDYADDAGVLAYVERVRERVASHKAAGASQVQCLVEQRLNYELITGERGAAGLANCLILAEYAEYADIDVIRPRFGELTMPGGADRIDALAAMLKFALLHTIRSVYLATYDPLTANTLEITPIEPDDLYSFGLKVTEAASLSLSLRGDVAALSHLVTGQVQCGACRVRHRCPEIIKEITREVYADDAGEAIPKTAPVPPQQQITVPDDLPQRLARAFGAVPLIEDWCLAVRMQVEAQLLQGNTIPGYKLVQAKNRLIEVAPASDPRPRYRPAGDDSYEESDLA